MESYFIPGNMIMASEYLAFSFSLILMIHSINSSCEQKGKLITVKLGVGVLQRNLSSLNFSVTPHYLPSPVAT